jgi:hypothetical protein
MKTPPAARCSRPIWSSGSSPRSPTGPADHRYSARPPVASPTSTASLTTTATSTSASCAKSGGTLVDVTDRALITRGLDEQRRYYIQHTLGYQVHDVDKPQHSRRHGRADLGWPTKEPQP